MKDWLMDHFFCSFLYSCELENVDKTAVRKEILALKGKTDSVKVSNVGGWHSDIFGPSQYSLAERYEELHKLQNSVRDASYAVLKEEMGGREKQEAPELDVNFWINVNETENYNEPHHHGCVALAAVYYVELPEQDKNSLVLLRTDAASYIQPPEVFNNEFAPELVVGRLYIFSPHLFHLVRRAHGRRISVAFNVFIRYDLNQKGVIE